MNLALFDLDHTLIPFDSGMAWMRFLTARAVLPAEAPETYLACCQAYVAGEIDIHAMHRATVKPMSLYPVEQIAAWGRLFEAEMAPLVPADMKALVARHRARGDLCAIVTATTRCIAEPFGRLFEVAHVVATEAAMSGGAMTGEIDGAPCHGEHKRLHVDRWLAGPHARAGKRLRDFERSWFYSDSAGDLPLLGAVSDPAVVRPDARLREHALRAGWPVLDAGP